MSEKLDNPTGIGFPEETETPVEFVDQGNISDLRNGDIFQFSVINSETGGLATYRCVFKGTTDEGEMMKFRFFDCDRPDDLVLPIEVFEKEYRPQIVYNAVKQSDLVAGEKYFFDAVDSDGVHRIFKGIFREKSYFEREGRVCYQFEVNEKQLFCCFVEDFYKHNFRKIASVESSDEGFEEEAVEKTGDAATEKRVVKTGEETDDHVDEAAESVRKLTEEV